MRVIKKGKHRREQCVALQVARRRGDRLDVVLAARLVRQRAQRRSLAVTQLVRQDAGHFDAAAVLLRRLPAVRQPVLAERLGDRDRGVAQLGVLVLGLAG